MVTIMAGRPKLLMIAGWSITFAITVFMLLDVSFDLRQAPIALHANLTLGIPANVVLPIGMAGLACTLLYLLPQTAMLGAIVLTGFLGGAAFTHIRINGSPWDVGENVLVGVLAWAGLWLRDARLRMLLPCRRPSAGQ